MSLQRSIELEQWDKVRKLLETNKGCAREKVYICDSSCDSIEDGDGEVDAYRRSATPLHLACIHDPPVDVVSRLLKLYPQAASTPSYLGWEYPLHYAVGSGKASDEVITTLIDFHPDAISKVSTAAGKFGHQQTPIHMATAKGSLPILKVMCRKNPGARSVRDGSGRTPMELHSAQTRDGGNSAFSEEVTKLFKATGGSNSSFARASSILLAVSMVCLAILLRQVERALSVFLDRAAVGLDILISVGSSGFTVAICIGIVALLIVNTTRIIQQEKATEAFDASENVLREQARDEFVTIIYVSAVGLTVVFSKEPVALLLNTTIVTGCALGYILFRRSRRSPRPGFEGLHGSQRAENESIGARRYHSDSSLREAAERRAAENGMCIVCWENPADHVLVPCGHLCLCADCPRRLGDHLKWKCPIGKCNVHAAMKVYPAHLNHHEDGEKHDNKDEKELGNQDESEDESPS